MPIGKLNFLVKGFNLHKFRGKISFLYFANFILFAFLSFVFSRAASAEVIGYDAVTAANKAVNLKAVTKGRFFPEGGRLVEFYLEGKHIGTTLSGGDGYALLEYLPLSPGIKHLKVKAGVDTDEGVFLVTGENDKVLLIEMEGILFVPTLRDLLQPVKESKEALQRLSKKFRIVYLTTIIGVKESKGRLKDNGFPSSVVLKWKGAALLDELQRQGIKPYAVIGSPAVVSECREHIKKRFSFEDTEDGVVVKDWKELLKQF